MVQNVVTYSTVIDVPNPDLRLKPGLTANVTIEIARRQNVVRIPNAALRFRPTSEIFAALNQQVPSEGRTGGSPEPPASPQPDAGSAPSISPTAPGAARSRGGMFTGDGARSGGGFDRQRMIERLQSMPPEQRDRILRRMRERGFDAGTGAEDATTGRPGLAPAREPSAGAPRSGGASTIDSLFGPLPPVQSAGRVWLFVNHQLKPVRVRLGISDGAFTELLSGEIHPGTELVTSATTGQPSNTPGRSPLMGPQRPAFGGSRQGGGQQTPRGR